MPDDFDKGPVLDEVQAMSDGGHMRFASDTPAPEAAPAPAPTPAAESAASAPVAGAGGAVGVGPGESLGEVGD